MSEWVSHTPRTAPYCHRGYSSTGELGTPKGDLIYKRRARRSPTTYGWRMLQAVPPEGIGEQELIEKLGGLSAYENYQQGIAELVHTGWLFQDPDGRYKPTE